MMGTLILPENGFVARRRKVSNTYYTLKIIWRSLLCVFEWEKNGWFSHTAGSLPSSSSPALLWAMRAYLTRLLWEVSRKYSQLIRQLIKVTFNLVYKFRVMVFKPGAVNTWILTAWLWVLWKSRHKCLDEKIFQRKFAGAMLVFIFH